MGAFFVQSCSTIKWTMTKPVRKALLKGDVCGFDHLAQMLPQLESVEEWTVDGVEGLVAAYAEQHAAGKVGSVAQPLRVAVSGGTVSPPIYDTLVILGRDRSMKRIRMCLESRAELTADA